MDVRLFVKALLATTAISAFAMAAEDPAATSRNDASSAGNLTGATETVVVTGATTHQAAGGGLVSASEATKSVQTVSSDYIAKQPPSTNPERLLGLEAGAVVAAPDAYGVLPGGITVRGLTNGEIGWTFEGAPFNDGGIYPNEVVDSPNLARISLVPGATDFDLPAAGAAAGAIQIILKDPQRTPGGYASLSYGSRNTFNQFYRVETGEIGNSGVRGYISYSNLQGKDARGPGADAREHVDMKFVKEWDNGSQSALVMGYNDINFQVERPPTLAQWNTLHRSFNYTSNFVRGDTNYYKLHENPYRNIFIAVPNTIVVTDDVKLYVEPYYYHGNGVIPGATNLSSSSAFIGSQRVSFLQLHDNVTGAASRTELLYSPTLPALDRIGQNSNVTWQLGNHALELGYWYEYNEHRNVGQYSFIGADGGPVNINGFSGVLGTPTGNLYRYTDFLVRQQVNDIYAGDRMKFMDGRLAIDAGFKEIMLTQNAFNRIPGTAYSRNDNLTTPLPSVAIRYDITEHHQIFSDAGVNAKLPEVSQLIDVISPTSGAFSTRGGTAQKPETSIIEELGYRYHDDLLVGSATFFNYNFTNRQLSTIAIQNGAMVTQYLNAGGQTSRGVDVSFGTRPFYHLRPFISAEYLNAKIDNNIARNGDYLRTTGKTATGSPTWTGNLGIDYDDETFFGNFQIHYVSSQYSTYMNDEKLPSFGTADMTVGYRLNDVGYAKHPQIQLNLVNLTDHKYLTGINGTSFNAVTTKGVYGTTIAGASPTYLVGGGFTAIVSVSSAF